MVARAAQVLFESGCNVADSSMTRLGGEFTVMLVLHLPPELTIHALAQRFRAMESALDLSVHLKPLPSFTAPLPTPTGHDGHFGTISVLGADKPGIVYRVTQLLAEENSNITDLYTQTIGTAAHPIYTMVIEVELHHGFDRLQQRLAQLERELGVDISLRPVETSLM